MTPKPGAKKRGPPPWEPSDRERNQVRILAGYGIPQDDIAAILGVKRTTLAKHCPKELSLGGLLANAKAAEFLFQRFAPPPGKEITDERIATWAAMFWLETRAGWRKGSNVTLSTEPGKPLEIAAAHAARARNKLIEELDQMASRIRQIESREAGSGDGGPGPPPEADQETIH